MSEGLIGGLPVVFTYNVGPLVRMSDVLALLRSDETVEALRKAIRGAVQRGNPHPLAHRTARHRRRAARPGWGGGWNDLP